jgi:predicted tellurium resistance membrane protein TerC
MRQKLLRRLHNKLLGTKEGVAMKLTFLYVMLAFIFSVLSLRKGSFCFIELCSKYQYNMSNSAIVYGAIALFFLIVSIKKLLPLVNFRNNSKLKVKDYFSNDNLDG